MSRVSRPVKDNHQAYFANEKTQALKQLLEFWKTFTCPYEIASFPILSLVWMRPMVVLTGVTWLLLLCQGVCKFIQELFSDDQCMILQNPTQVKGPCTVQGRPVIVIQQRVKGSLIKLQSPRCSLPLKKNTHKKIYHL